MNEKLGVTTALGLFGLVVSASYLRSYWGAFDIDVFQFAGLTDFAKLAVYPLLMSTLGWGIGLFVSMLLFRVSESQETAGLSVSGAARLRVAAVASVVLAPLPILIWSKPWTWIACIFLASPAIFQVSDLPVSRRYIPAFSRRFTAVLMFAAFPLLAALGGALSAEGLKMGLSPRIVDKQGVAADLMGTPDHPLMYIGYVNDTFVIYETQTGSVVLVKQVDNAPLILKPNPKRDISFSGFLKVLGLTHHD